MAENRLTALTQRIGQLPFVTISIIALNVLATAMARSDMIYYECYVAVYGLVPEHFRVGSLLSSTFIHDGYVHLAMNMALLYVFGSAVERAMGRLEYVMFYIGACFAASLMHIAIVYATLPPYYATRAVVGASGAVAGVMGVYAVRFHRRSFHFGGMELPALLLIMLWLILQVVLGVLGLYRDEVLGLGLKQVGYWSHLGGFGFGIGVALIANMALHGEREYLINQAARNDAEGNLLEAIQNYEHLLKYDPDNALCHAEIGRLWGILEEEDDSLRNFHMAIELYVSQGQEEKALEVAQQMAQFWPSTNLSSATRFRLASYLEEAGQPERAIAAFEQIAQSDPDSAEAQMSLLKVGQLQLISLGKPSLAILTLHSFLDRYPRSEWRRFAVETLLRAEGTSPHV